MLTLLLTTIKLEKNMKTFNNDFKSPKNCTFYFVGKRWKESAPWRAWEWQCFCWKVSDTLGAGEVASFPWNHQLVEAVSCSLFQTTKSLSKLHAQELRFLDLLVAGGCKTEVVWCWLCEPSCRHAHRIHQPPYFAYILYMFQLTDIVSEKAINTN